MSPCRLAAALLLSACALAPAAAAFLVTSGASSQSFVACLAGDGSAAGAPDANPNAVAAQIIEYQMSYNSFTKFISVTEVTGNKVVLVSNGAPAPGSAFQLSIPGDYADRGRATGMVRLSGASCTTASASVPTLACQGTPMTGAISLTADNRYVVLAGYDMAAGTRIVQEGQVASTLQNISLPPVGVNRVVGVVDLVTTYQQVAVSVSSACLANGAPYPCEITSATYVKNASDPNGGGQFLVATGWGTATGLATTQTVATPFGIKATGFTAGLPSNGGLVQVIAPGSTGSQGGILSTMANAGAMNVIQTAAGGSGYYIKYLRAPKLYNNTVHYALNSKGVSACTTAGPPAAGQACGSAVIAQSFLAFSLTGSLNVKDYVFTGISSLWMLDGDLGLHYFSCPLGGTTTASGCGGTSGQVYVTTPPNVYAYTSQLVNSSAVSVTAVQESAGLTTFIMVAQQSVIWAWAATNNGPYVDGVGNCCGAANRLTPGASCCWANNNQPVATAPANTFFRGLAAPVLGPAPFPTPSPSATPSNTPSISVTPSGTPSPTSTVSGSPSISSSVTGSPSTTPSATPTPTPTTTLTAGASPSNTATISVTVSVSPTSSRTPSTTSTPTRTPSPSPSRTPSNTPTNSPTPSQTPSPTQSKGSAPLPPIVLTWSVTIGWASGAALTPAQAQQMSPALVCGAYVSTALTSGFASLLGIPAKNVAILSTTDSATGAKQTECARRVLLSGKLFGRASGDGVGGVGGGGGRALQAATTEIVALSASLGPSLGVRDQQAALQAILNVEPSSPVYQTLIAAVAVQANLSASLFAVDIDHSLVKLGGGVGAASSSSSGSGAVSAVGGALGGVVGAIALFAGFATLRYYLVKGRLPPICGKSTKTSAQKRDISAVRAENEALKANPLASVRLSREDSQKIADSLAEMTPEELEELKQLKARKRAEKAAKAAAAAAAAADKSSFPPTSKNGEVVVVT